MKRFVSMFLATLTIVAALTVSSAAYSEGVKTNSCGVTYVQASRSNYSVNGLIVRSIVDKANTMIENMVERELSKRNPDIPGLIEKTNVIASGTIKIAAMLGVEVKCEYKAYEYNGTVFYVDPLIVIRRSNVT